MSMIVVAEDMYPLRQLVKASIACDGCEIVDAADGETAWALIKEHRPALAVIDVRMPGLSGIELLRRVRADETLSATRVILLTGVTQGAEFVLAREAGADALMKKPFSPSKLRRMFEELVVC